MGAALSPQSMSLPWYPLPLVPLTRAAELILLYLGHVETTELGWSSTLGEEPNGGALAQPL